MKFTVQRDQFAKMLSRAQGIVEKKTTVAVLSHLLLETSGSDTVKLTCTDYDVVLLDSCPAQVEREGKAVISGKTLYDILRVLPPVDIQIEKEGGERIVMVAGNSKYNLSGFEPDDFPRIEKTLTEPGFSIPAATLRAMLSKTAFCMSQEEARMNLNGVYIDIRKDGATVQMGCVATDGHRLAKVEYTLEGVELPFAAKSVIVHRKGVTEVKKIVEGESGEVFLGFGSGEVLFKAGTAALYVREIDEEYPDYRSVIPEGFARELTVSGAELVAAMKRVLPLADPAVSVVRLEVRPETLHVSSTNPQSGTGETTIFAEYSGDQFSVGFNHRYLLESASAIQSEQLRIKMNEPGTPCEVVPLDPEEKAIYVLMPIEEA